VLSSVLAGCGDFGTGSGGAATALAALAVKGRAPHTGYSRAQFGRRWADTDHNGCDQRNDVLARDLRQVRFRQGSRDCVVVSGVLDDPYTGQSVAFQRGQGTSEQVQIDHVVSLSDAWSTGAQQLTPAAREELANDPLELIAVSGTVNDRKGDGDAATWLPPRRAFRCTYVARQIAVKRRYHLWVTPAERAAMAGVLTRCPTEPLPTSSTPLHLAAGGNRADAVPARRPGHRSP